MRRRVKKYFYDFDEIGQVTHGFIQTLEASCLSSDTMKILANNSRVFRASAYPSTDLRFGGFVRMEIPEQQRSLGLGDILSNMMNRGE